MRLLLTVGAGLMLSALSRAAFAAHPPLDRPSPPPCCADGRCYPNPLTFGWYETRWRRWPMECMDTMPADQLGPASQPSSDIRPYDPPPPDEEDRRAPPPTTPPDEPSRGPATNDATSGTEGRSMPGPASPLGAPPPSLLQPGQPTEPSTPRRGTLPPYEPQGPTPKSLDSSGPTSDADPPPSLPFGRNVMSAAPPMRKIQQPSASPTSKPTLPEMPVPTDDPPPSLPGVLAAVGS